jgi:hypothetical protein
MLRLMLRSDVADPPYRQTLTAPASPQRPPNGLGPFLPTSINRGAYLIA